MSKPGEILILAELMFDERAPGRSGRLLVEWAGRCQASGVVIPQWPWMTPGFVQQMLGDARTHRLKGYVELGSSMTVERADALNPDGYLLRDLHAVEGSLIHHLRHRGRSLLLLVSDTHEMLSARVRALLDPMHVIVVCAQRHDHPQPLLMQRVEQAWGGPVGYADRSTDVWPAVSSVWLGSRVIIKGLTLNRSLCGPTHVGSLYPHELHGLIERIRQQEALLRGQPWTDDSLPGRFESARLGFVESLVTARPLRVGDALQPNDIKRIGELRGLSATMAPQLLGARLLYDRQPDEPITFGVVEPLPGRTEQPALDIAVVIRIKNEGQWLRRCLAALVHQRQPPHEIIVVDNASSDDTVEIAQAFDCRVLNIPDEKFSFGRALNMGIAAARSPWVVSLSAHCVPVHDLWLSAFACERSSFSVAAIYGRQEPLPDTSDFDKRDLWTTFGQERRLQHGQDYFFHNANSLINKAVWESMPFDEEINGVEDRDWAKRVLADGYQIVYAPLASVHHYHGIHQGRNEDRARRVAKVIELIQSREPASVLSHG